MRLRSLQGIDMRRSRGLIGFPASSRSLPRTSFDSVTVRRAFDSSASVPRAIRSPSKPLFVSRPARPRRVVGGAPPMGFPFPLFAASARSVVTTSSHACRLSVLGVSHALDGFVRCVPCGFISPRYHVQGLLAVQGVHSSSASVPPRRWPMPSRCWPAFAKRCCLATSPPRVPPASSSGLCPALGIASSSTRRKTRRRFGCPLFGFSGLLTFDDVATVVFE